MAWATMNFRSGALNMPVEAEVLIPQPGYKSLTQKEGYKVIILLHGANNDRMEWLMKSQIADMVRELPVIVFMPSGKNSFYINTWNGYRYMDFIGKEIPELIRSHFRVSEKKEDWLIAGESMGGFGASVCGFNHPDTFGNVAVFSGALAPLEIEKDLPGIKMTNLFGKNYEYLEKPENDPFRLSDALPEEKRPRVFLCCGTEDFLLDVNERFYHHLKDRYDLTVVWKLGGHEFVYWNERLKEMFQWFMAKELEEGFFMGRGGNDIR